MKYEVKVFTPDFKKKVDEYIQSELSSEELIDKPFKKRFQELDIRSSLCYMWNHSSELNDKIKNYYTSLGLYPVQYETKILDAADYGLQSMARIVWNGVVTKIEEIEEIFSFKRLV